MILDEVKINIKHLGNIYVVRLDNGKIEVIVPEIFYDVKDIRVFHALALDPVWRSLEGEIIYYGRERKFTF